MFNQWPSSIWNRTGMSNIGHPNHNHVELTLVTPPAAEPVSLTMAKLQARVSFPDEDALLALYISAARDKVERYLRRALITQTWDMVCDWGPAWIELPKPPLQSVVSIFTTGLDNVETAVSPSLYVVNPASNWVGLNLGAVWPIHRGKAGFRVRFTVGYGDTPASVPAQIRHEILTLIAKYDDTRDENDLPESMKSVLRAYRVEGQPFRMAPGSAREDILA